LQQRNATGANARLECEATQTLVDCGLLHYKTVREFIQRPSSVEINKNDAIALTRTNLD